MAQCNRDDCEERAVGSLVGLDGYQRAYRCVEHLQSDLPKVTREKA